MTTPRLGAPELVTSQTDKEETVNEQIRYIESGAGHFIFKDRDLATPPGSPADGDCYLIAGSPTGAWAGHAGDIAFRLNTVWVFIEAIEGFTAAVNDEDVFIMYDGAAWNVIAAPSGSYLPLTGGTLSGDLVVPDEAYDATAWNGSLEVPTKNAVRDKIEDILDGVTFTGDIVVPDEAYDATNWNGSLEVPTKNAVRDKIETLSAGAYTDEQAQDAVGTILTDTGLAVVTYSDATPSIDVNVPAAAGSDFRTGTDATKALTSDSIWDAADYVTLNDSGGNIAVDMSTGFNFAMTMDGDYNLSNPTNTKNGQTGCIVFTQDGTGTQTLSYSSNWKFAGGTDPTLSTPAGSVDVLFYQVISSTSVLANLVKAIA